MAKFKLEAFLGKNSIGYLYYRGCDLCIGGTEDKAIIYDDESFKEARKNTHSDYKLRKRYIDEQSN